MEPKTLTDDEQEELWERIIELDTKISDAVTELVNKMLVGVDPDIEEEVRTRLTEQYRFWKD